VQTGVRVERRQVERVPIRVPITIIGTRGKIDAVATDISTKGCAVQAEANANIPTTGPLAITLHFGDAPIEIALVRIAFTKGGLMGIEFRQIAPTMQARLADHVAALTQRRKPGGS
jgi:c-di-GMP-binding flagellar brake protein YcgR